MSREVKVGNEWVRVAGRGKAEYGASHYQTGTVAITARATAYGTYGVEFSEPMPDTDYIVVLEINGLTGGNWHHKTFNVSYDNKTVNGFVICVGHPNDTAIEAGVTVKWQAFKLYTDKEYDGLLDDVATLKTITSGTATVNTANLYNSGTQVSNCSYRKCGKTVQVQFTAFFKTALTWGSPDMVLFSGLPKAVSTITPVCYNITKRTICDVQMNTAGKITAFDGINAMVAVDDRVTSSFCYLTAE